MRRTVLLCTAVFMLAAGIAQAAPRGDGSTAAPTGIVRLVTHVPSSTLDRVGAGTLPVPTVTALHGAPLTHSGKPELLNVDLAWCPHCAADSWALAVALGRFGALLHLRLLDSGTLFLHQVPRAPLLPPHPRTQLPSGSIPQPVPQLR